MTARHGRRLLIDAMSAFGALPLDARRVPFDAVVASANKCLEGVPGGRLRDRPARGARGGARPGPVAQPRPARPVGRDGEERAVALHAAHPRLAALDRALDQHAAEGGVAGRGARYRRNCAQLVEGLRALGFETLLPDRLQAPIIVTVRMPADPKFHFETFYERLQPARLRDLPGQAHGRRQLPHRLHRGPRERARCAGSWTPSANRARRAGGGLRRARPGVLGRPPCGGRAGTAATTSRTAGARDRPAAAGSGSAAGSASAARSILLVLSLVFGQNFFALLDGSGDVSTGAAAAARRRPRRARPRRRRSSARTSCRSCSTTCRTPGRASSSRRGATYQRAKLVLFTDATRSGCGVGRGRDRPVLLPGGPEGLHRPRLLRRAAEPLRRARATSRRPTCIAHEIGHHVQNLLGVDRRRCARPQERSPARPTRSRCGSSCRPTASPASGRTPPSERGSSRRATSTRRLGAASAVGDDRIQKQAGGRRQPGDLDPRVGPPALGLVPPRPRDRAAPGLRHVPHRAARRGGTGSAAVALRRRLPRPLRRCVRLPATWRSCSTSAVSAPTSIRRPAWSARSTACRGTCARERRWRSSASPAAASRSARSR